VSLWWGVNKFLGFFLKGSTTWLLSNISRTISKKNSINKISANLLDGDRENGVYNLTQ
jgi:hypothetical protein